MGKKYRNLIESVADMSNLYNAYNRASKGKRYSHGHLEFKEHLHANLLNISTAILDNTYRPSPPRLFFVYEPKKRQISALNFTDRVVQHALCAILDPIFENTFLPHSYACRKNKGTHKAVIKAQSMMRNGVTHHLKMDFSKYFASIDISILYNEIKRKISCNDTLKLIETFVTFDSNGLPIGNLTSQLFANVYGHIFDRYIVHDLKINKYIRYMDDTVIFSTDVNELKDIQIKLETFSRDNLKLNFSKWSINHITNGLDWLGYRIWTTHKLLRKQSVTRAKRKITKYIKANDIEKLKTFAASWKAHAQWANSYNLFRKLKI